jgi:hypothetical protein
MAHDETLALLSILSGASSASLWEIGSRPEGGRKKDRMAQAARSERASFFTGGDRYFKVEEHGTRVDCCVLNAARKWRTIKYPPISVAPEAPLSSDIARHCDAKHCEMMAG